MADIYLCIRCVIPAPLEEDLPELLEPWPILGTEIEEISNAALRIIVYLPRADKPAADGVIQALTEAGAIEIDASVVEAADWLAEFRASLRPFEVGERWWIDPNPDDPTPAPERRQRLVLEPRMAFGTGTHESTRGILSVLERMEVTGGRVLDVGTGSGVLALAAESLGAGWVVGLDIDPTAVWVAAECAAQQEWVSGVGFVVGSVDCLSAVEFDIVLCNMIASNFLPLASALRKLLADAGVAVFAGLLASEVGPVSLALEDAGFEVSTSHTDGEWASLLAVAVVAP